MSKITSDGLTRSGTRYFIAAYGNRQQIIHRRREYGVWSRLTRVKAFSDGSGIDHVAFTQAARYTWIHRLETHFALHHASFWLHSSLHSLHTGFIVTTSFHMHKHRDYQQDTTSCAFR